MVYGKRSGYPVKGGVVCDSRRLFQVCKRVLDISHPPERRAVLAFPYRSTAAVRLVRQ